MEEDIQKHSYILIKTIKIDFLCSAYIHHIFFGFNKMTILLTSKSPLKIEAVKKVLNDLNVKTVSLAGKHEQPFGPSAAHKRDSLECAQYRIDNACLEDTKDIDFIVAIENGIVKEDGVYYDVCDVVIYDAKEKQNYSTLNMPFDSMVKIGVPGTHEKDIWNVYSKDGTVGSQIAQKFKFMKDDGKTYDGTNWMKHLGIDRIKQMEESLAYVHNFMKHRLQDDIRSRVIVTPNFPQGGVVFQDYQKVFGDIKLAKRISSYFCRNLNIIPEHTLVVGPELRGYMGCYIADILGCNHLMLRKSKNGKFKMAGDVVTEQLKQKEYSDGEEAFYCLSHIVKDKIVIMFDDLLATGGSIKACSELVKKCGGHVIKMCFLSDVPDCRGKAQETLGDDYQKVDVVFDSETL